MPRGQPTLETMTPSRLVVAAILLGAAITVPAPARAQCGVMSHHPRRYAHVVWIWLENHSAQQIIGSTDAPYINSVADGCGLATNFHNITHVSLPNYIGAVTGLALPDLVAFQFDCNPGSTCSTAAASIFGQVPSWKAYMESMTTTCESTGLVGYAVRHNPPPYLTTLSNCGTFDVP